MRRGVLRFVDHTIRQDANEPPVFQRSAPIADCGQDSARKP